MRENIVTIDKIDKKQTSYTSDKKIISKNNDDISNINKQRVDTINDDSKDFAQRMLNNINRVCYVYIYILYMIIRYKGYKYNIIIAIYILIIYL